MIIMESLNTYFIYSGDTFQSFMCDPVYSVCFTCLFSHYTFFTAGKQIFVTMVIVCHPLTDVLPRNKEKMPLEIS